MLYYRMLSRARPGRDDPPLLYSATLHAYTPSLGVRWARGRWWDAKEREERELVKVTPSTIDGPTKLRQRSVTSGDSVRSELN